MTQGLSELHVDFPQSFPGKQLATSLYTAESPWTCGSPADCAVLPVNQLARADGADGAAVCGDTFSVLHPRCHRAVKWEKVLIAVSLSLSVSLT